MVTVVHNQRGSALIIAVIAMLIMGVLSISFSLLANIETTIGYNFKAQAQAEALAEAGLSAALDTVRAAGGVAGSGFTTWFGAPSNHILANGVALGAGQYWARIDNDCAVANTVPATIQEPPHSGTPCDNTTDYNEKAVVTAWATAGTGRSRVRGVIGVDSPWKHVCSDAVPDNGGYCNDTRNTKGNPTVVPADPNAENGPRAYNDLPRPILGCSRIDYVVHRGTAAMCAGTALYAQPAAGGYAAYPPLASAPQLVIMGEDPAITTGAKTCSGGGQTYFGYFDCALSAPCPAGVCGAIRKACVKAGDTRITSDPTNYASNGGAPGGCGANTGMVFKGTTGFGTDIGNTTTAYVIYVMHDSAAPSTADVPTASDNAPGHTFYGTLVVEGNAYFHTKSVICSGGPAPNPIPSGYCSPTPTGTAYGYPMAMLTYDPKLAYPTVSPYAPQPITTDFGTPNAVINGIVYGGGHISFNPINVNGSTVGFDINLQASSSTYTYISDYGNAAPPPGFPASGDPVVVILKSFITCSTYSDESAGTTACN